MNFSVLHFFKFASRMPQIAQILVSTFKIFRRGGGGGGGDAPRPPRNFLSIFHLQFQALNLFLCPDLYSLTSLCAAAILSSLSFSNSHLCVFVCVLSLSLCVSVLCVINIC